MSGIDYETMAREALVNGHGPTIAAWLIWPGLWWRLREKEPPVRVGDYAKDKFRKNGVVDFVFRPGEQVPDWFKYGMECLASRRWWAVEELRRGPLRVHRVKWLRWGGWKKVVGVPREIATAGSS